MTVADSIDSEAGQTAAVLYEVTAAGVALITLNRPERLNSWGADISRGVYAAFDRAEADEDVRVVVLTGTGRGFCAGAYMGAMQDLGASISGDTDVSKIVGERHPHFLTTLRKPVIAAINGACVGIGLTHALMCDVRFAAAGAKFTTAFPRRGLHRANTASPGSCPDWPAGARRQILLSRPYLLRRRSRTSSVWSKRLWRRRI